MRVRSRARKAPFVLAAALAAAVATGLLLQAADASAQSPQAFPSKPVRFLISFTPGGTTDTLARTLAERMAKAWGQPVLPENRPGAAGVIAAEMTARAPADGHTLLMASSGYAINATLQPKLPYDSVKDITGVAIVADLPNIVIVHPSLPVRTIGDLLALARKRPGQLSYASAGTGSSQHLAGELFKTMTRTNIVHVPYKGGVPATTDLIGGHVDLTFGSTANLPGVRAGRLRAIAVTTAKRSPALPDLPTVDESGVPGYREQTADLRWASPDDTTAFVHGEIRRWGEVVRRSGARTN
ncbi:MAG: tripartite tricarboxylate transporter substrate binding protein [Proteobacteria bacterium]|nr:tripartite tricarboxylate transporter substrate binding protein [Pseudomonadota bacterium]